MLGKQILASKGYWNPKENWREPCIFRDDEATILLKKKTVKYRAMYGIFFQIEALLSQKNAWLPHIFFLGTKSTC